MGRQSAPTVRSALTWAACPLSRHRAPEPYSRTHAGIQAACPARLPAMPRITGTRCQQTRDRPGSPGNPLQACMPGPAAGESGAPVTTVRPRGASMQRMHSSSPRAAGEGARGRAASGGGGVVAVQPRACLAQQRGPERRQAAAAAALQQALQRRARHRGHALAQRLPPQRRRLRGGPRPWARSGATAALAAHARLAVWRNAQRGRRQCVLGRRHGRTPARATGCSADTSVQGGCPQFVAAHNIAGASPAATAWRCAGAGGGARAHPPCRVAQRGQRQRVLGQQRGEQARRARVQAARRASGRLGQQPARGLRARLAGPRRLLCAPRRALSGGRAAARPAEQGAEAGRHCDSDTAGGRGARARGAPASAARMPARAAAGGAARSTGPNACAARRRR